MSLPTTLGFRDPGDYARLRERFTELGFDAAAFREVLRTDPHRIPVPTDYPRMLERLGAGPRDDLLRLFVLGVPVPRAAAEAAFAPLPLARVVEAGLLEPQGDALAPRVRIRAARERLFLTDPLLPAGAEVPADFVMGIGSSTLMLANFAVHSPARTTLDWGTGCGCLALLAAAYSERVVGVDCNPRAIAYARFNAALAGAEGCEFVAGRGFEPLAGRRFDRVLANPPFVISPAARFVYRDSGIRGDLFCRQLVRDVAQHLEEGGIAQVVVHWIDGPEAPLESWWEGSGCDAWVLRSDTWDPDAYATLWLEQGDPNRFEAEYREWLAFFRKEGIGAVHGGLATFRRRAEPGHTFWQGDAPERMLGPAGDAVLRGLAARSWLAAHPTDPDVLAARFRVAPEVRLDQTSRLGDAGWQPSGARLRLAAGLAYEVDLDTYVTGLVASLDGSTPLGAVADAMAARTGSDASRLRQEVASLVRSLVERGFVLPV